jgi:metallo-beta-lactamase class B
LPNFLLPEGQEKLNKPVPDVNSTRKMKNTSLVILFLLIPLSVFSQDVIRITPDLELFRISENAYVHVSYSTVEGYGRISANGLIFINKNKAFLFDTPWNDSQTSALVSYIKDKMKLEIEGFAPNHWHADCMGGLQYLKSQKIKSYANQVTIEIAEKLGLPVPDAGFRDSLKLPLGDKFIYCYFFGAAHSTDNIVVWIPSEDLLFPGCMCKSINSENLGNISDGDLSEYPKTISKVIHKFRAAKIVIPGHGPIGGPELLTHTEALIARQKH